MSQESINHWLSLQPKSIVNGMQVLSNDDTGPLYHLSTDGDIKKFIPYVTRRAARKENISVPRVSVATSIMGCFIGYAQSWSQTVYPLDQDKKFKNGWYLYEIPYEYCIKPSKKLLFDQEYSDEHWLVTYDTATREYRGNIVAKLFYSELRVVPRTGTVPDYLCKLVIEVLSDTPVRLGGEIRLTKGCWLIDGLVPDGNPKWDNMAPYKVTPISYGEYAKLKGYSADMLSFSDPIAFKW